MSNRCRNLLATVVVLGLPIVALGQTPAAGKTLAVTGHAGQAPVVQMNGKSYIDLESLARLTGGSLSFHGNQTTLTLTPGSARPAPVADTPPPPKPGLSVEFVKAGIEVMAEIREWRIAIVNAVQTNSPVTDDWVSGYRRAAENRLSLARAAASTDQDQQGAVMLQNTFNDMRQMSDQFLQMKQNMSYISPNSFDNNPLDQKILTCSRALAAMAANGQVQDEISCR